MRASHSTVTAAPRGTAANSLAALIAAGVLWGTGGPLGSLLGQLAHLSVLAVATYRLLIGGAAIIAVLTVARGRLPRGHAAWRRIIVIGVLSALYQTSYFAAIALTSVSIATLVTIGATPVLVVAVEVTTGRQRVTRRVAATVVLAVIGLALLTGVPAGHLSTVRVLAGTVTALIAAAGFAAVTLLGARPVAGLDELTMTGGGFAVGGLILTPFAASFGDLGFTPAPVTVVLVLALGIAPTAAAYLLYFRALRHASAATAALLSLLEPLTATVLAVIFLGNHLNDANITGAVLLGVTVLLTTAPHQRDRRHRADRNDNASGGDPPAPG